MPALAIEPSGSTVERLCGQPEQKYGCARQRQRRGPLAQRLQERHARRDRLELNAALEARGDDLGDPVGVELAVGGHERPALLVGLADDPRALGLVVEDVADEELAERPLLLDDQELLEAPGELANGARLHREQHLDLQQADAVLAERGVVEPELGERLAQVVVGLAGRGDAEPRVRRRQRDAVEPVGGGERLRRLEPPVVDLALGLQAPRRHQQRILPRLPGPSLVDEAGIGDDDPVRRHLGGADLVGDVGHDLEAHPEPGVARQLEAETAEVEDFLRAAGIEHREQRVVERHLRVRRDRGRLRERVVAAERQHAAVTADAGEVRVLEDVAGPVDAGPLPYHMPRTPSYFGCGNRLASWLP